MLRQVLVTEFIKLRRCKVTWFSLAALSMGPFGIALMMWIVRDPQRAAQLGLLGTKADLSGLEATWSSFAYALVLIVGVGGMLLLAFIVAYVFGSEYGHGTAKNMLALPVPRHWFAVGKLLVIGVWWLAIVCVAVLLAIMLGLALGLPGLSGGIVLGMVGKALLAAGISLLLAPLVAWIAAAGRGYLAPLAFALVMMGLGNLFGHTGWAQWFPWSIVPLLIGAVAEPVASLPAASYLVPALTFMVGVAATILQLRYADNAG